MTGIYILIIGILLIGTAVLMEIWKEIHEFKVVEYRISTKKLKERKRPLRIAFLSDLHNHVYGENNKDLLEAIRKGNPDYILIGGDMLVGRKEKYDFKEAIEFVKQLPLIAPVYYSNGNHEERMHLNPENYGDSYVQYKETLEKEGIYWLENDYVSFSWEGDKFSIYGVELPIQCYMTKDKHWLEIEDLSQQVGKPDMKAYNILLAHHPSFAKVYEKWGADLTLSGHMHGGVARLPIIGGVISPQFGLFPNYSGGIYEINQSQIVVSKGLGTHTIHVRFWNPAELIFLEINGKK